MRKRMYNAAGRDLHIDVPLSNIAMVYRPQGMIADQLAPIVRVGKQSDLYPIWDPADAFRIEKDERAPATEANLIKREVSSGSYFAKNYQLKDRIPWEDTENMDDVFVQERRNGSAMYLKSKLILGWEYRLASMCTSGSNVGSYSAVASYWTAKTSGNSDPIGDINLAINNVEGATGYRPNKVLFGGRAWQVFREHADVIGRIYGQAAGGPARIVTREQTKAIFEVDEVLIGNAMYSTGDPGLAMALTRLWSTNVLVYFAPPTPSVEAPSFMYTFRWPKIMDLDMAAKTREDDVREATEIELGFYQDIKITAKALGYLLTGVSSN